MVVVVNCSGTESNYQGDHWHPHRSSTSSREESLQEQAPIPRVLWRSTRGWSAHGSHELDYSFMGWMDRQEGWGGTRCLGSEKADLLGIANETVLPHSQTLGFRGGSKYGIQDTWRIGKTWEGKKTGREGTAVHLTPRQAHTRKHTRARTCTPSSYSELPLTHCSTESLSQQNHVSQGSTPGQGAPPS